MKKLILFTLVAVISVGFYGCSAEQLIGSMSSSIDGASWTAGTPGGTIQNNRIIVTGVGQNQNISITINSAQTGTFPIDVLQQTNYVTYTSSLNSNPQVYGSTSGSITVTSVGNNRISGTFNAVVSNGQGTITITNGKFTNILYI